MGLIEIGVFKGFFSQVMQVAKECMAKKYICIWSPSWAIREMKTKTSLRLHLILIRMAKATMLGVGVGDGDPHAQCPWEDIN